MAQASARRPGLPVPLTVPLTVPAAASRSALPGPLLVHACHRLRPLPLLCASHRSLAFRIPEPVPHFLWLSGPPRTRTRAVFHRTAATPSCPRVPRLGQPPPLARCLPSWLALPSWAEALSLALQLALPFWFGIRWKCHLCQRLPACERVGALPSLSNAPPHLFPPCVCTFLKTRVFVYYMSALRTVGSVQAANGLGLVCSQRHPQHQERCFPCEGHEIVTRLVNIAMKTCYCKLRK